MDIKVDRKGAVKRLRKLVLTPKMDVEVYRENLKKEFTSYYLPNKVECLERDYGGVQCDLLSPEVYSSKRIILYIHGGSFVGGSKKIWRGFCSSLANECACRVVVPEFRLPPSYPYPASIDDLVQVFRTIYSEEMLGPVADENFNARPKIILAADGSGASFALALLFKINAKYRDSISNVVLFSPWLDLASESKLIESRQKDEIICGADMHRAVDLYTFATNFTNYLVSPLRASSENFESFPSVYIQMGEKEMLLSQVEEFRSLLGKNGIECILDVWPNMMYMFQMADDYLPESHLAMERIGKYIRNKESDTEEEGVENKVTLRKE